MPFAKDTKTRDKRGYKKDTRTGIRIAETEMGHETLAALDKASTKKKSENPFHDLLKKLNVPMVLGAATINDHLKR